VPGRRQIYDRKPSLAKARARRLIEKKAGVVRPPVGQGFHGQGQTLPKPVKMIWRNKTGYAAH